MLLLQHTATNVICHHSHKQAALPTHSEHICQLQVTSHQTLQFTHFPSWPALLPAVGFIFVHAVSIKALGLLHASGGEKQMSNYNGMGGKGIVRGRTDAERQEKTIRLIQLINIINVIIFLL